MWMENVNWVRNNCLCWNPGTNSKAVPKSFGQIFAYLKGCLPVMATLKLLLVAQQLLGSKFFLYFLFFIFNFEFPVLPVAVL